MPDVAAHTRHIPHGMLRLSSGKMSSRTGDVITAEWLIQEVKNRLPENTDEAVAMASIKYSILRQNIGSDIIFDFDKSVTFQGDSGPYLQYTYARLKSILRKLQITNYKLQIADTNVEMDALERHLAVLILRFPEAIEDALAIYSPHVLAAYLYNLAKSANEFYHARPVMQEEDADKKNLRLALVSATAITLARGLNLLGIETLEEM